MKYMSGYDIEPDAQFLPTFRVQWYTKNEKDEWSKYAQTMNIIQYKDGRYMQPAFTEEEESIREHLASLDRSMFHGEVVYPSGIDASVWPYFAYSKYVNN